MNCCQEVCLVYSNSNIITVLADIRLIRKILVYHFYRCGVTLQTNKKRSSGYNDKIHLRKYVV